MLVLQYKCLVVINTWIVLEDLTIYATLIVCLIIIQVNMAQYQFLSTAQSALYFTRLHTRSLIYHQDFSVRIYTS